MNVKPTRRDLKMFALGALAAVFCVGLFVSGLFLVVRPRDRRISLDTRLQRATCAGDIPAMRWYLFLGADPENPFSGPALVSAARSRNFAVVRFVCALGVYPDVAGKEGVTPLMIAARNGSLDIVQFLLDLMLELNPSSLRDRIPPALELARQGHHDRVAALLQTTLDDLPRRFPPPS